MKKNLFKGSLFTVGASLWWGVIGVIYFKFVSFASALELAIHRTIWTALLLIITTSYYSKWSEFNKIIRKRVNIFIFFITGLLISINWITWLYAVKTNPSEKILKHIMANGIKRFDVASINEIRLVKKLKDDAKLYFMHTVKSRENIAEAYFSLGVRDFALDTKDELMKILE